jgi:hypothetical protein
MRDQAMMREDERDRVARQGMQAWARLKKGKSWSDWLAVGEAMQVGREWAMHQAGVNRPEGKGYNMAFGEWLAKYKLDDMDKGDRSRLFSVMDNLPAIEEWRQRLTLTEKLALNHPQAVLRKWKAFIEPEKPKSDKPTLRDENIRLDEENATLKLQIAELEAARETAPGAVTSGLGDLIAGLLTAGKRHVSFANNWSPDELAALPHTRTDVEELARKLMLFAADLVKARRKTKPGEADAEQAEAQVDDD